MKNGELTFIIYFIALRVFKFSVTFSLLEKKKCFTENTGSEKTNLASK